MIVWRILFVLLLECLVFSFLNLCDKCGDAYGCLKWQRWVDLPLKHGARSNQPSPRDEPTGLWVFCHGSA